jgi:hypothetical protein
MQNPTQSLTTILNILANPDLTRTQSALLTYLNAQPLDEVITNYTILGEDTNLNEYTIRLAVRELVRLKYMKKKTLSKVGILISEFRG